MIYRQILGCLSLLIWNHIAYQATGRQRATIVNDIAKTGPQGRTLAHDLSHFEHPKDFNWVGLEKKLRGLAVITFGDLLLDILMRSVSRQLLVTI